MIATLRRGLVSATLRSPSRAVIRLVADAVPPPHRELDPLSGDLVIFGSHVAAAVAALEGAGVTVVEVGGGA